MSSWISRSSYSHNSQLAVTAVASGALAASLVLGYQAARRKNKVESVKAHIPEPGQDHPTTRVWTLPVPFANRLTDQAKLTEYGAASDHVFAPSKEDERSLALAIRARSGDYDDGTLI